jgi:hypothetical protein
MRVADRPGRLFLLGPVVRLQQVAIGIAELADELEAEGVDARKLRAWSIELTSIRVELEHRYQPKPLV